MEKYIQNKLKHLNLIKITPIQQKVFEKFEEKSNLICVAPTGTGKTYAYLLPVLSKIIWDKNIIQAVIVVPTNELVFQTLENLNKIENKKSQIKIFFGGMNRIKTYKKLEKKQPSIIISTLEKLFEYAYNLKKINIYKSSFLILDEADMFLESNYLSLLKTLLSKWKPKILFFSASIDKKTKPFIDKHFGKSIFININEKQKLNLNYYISKSPKNNRIKDLIQFLNQKNPFFAFIFVSNKKEQLNIYEILKKKFNILNFSSNFSVKERKRKMIEIKKNKYQYVITSDLASRGLDIEDISWIIHYDLPKRNLKFFQHRNGRTGRMNKQGNILLFYDNEDENALLKIKQKNNIKFNKIILSNKEKFSKKIKTKNKKIFNFKKIKKEKEKLFTKKNKFKKK
ncbi:helicase domain protein [Candidatus Phytoplasma oryzae]|uniref:DNA helicase n=1 Tax=Candidatus Phytoplasma oryzae TaxID=203274 RepID=A0A139JQ69_9MOLU|nr:DEAD/DEAH box helicase [Candidatus Phytoplasma oryzae]KXT29115.1 helicase domain protein [Candidatus Phytoplasma oryzae]RAM57813.1 DNA helicase [Candidatus Phytoplasma oryzae]